jgi:hypothetical protein
MNIIPDQEIGEYQQYPANVDAFATHHNHPGWVETIRNMKDFLNVLEYAEREGHPGVAELPEFLQKALPQTRHAVSVDAFNQPADSWTSSVFTLGANPAQIIRERADRLRVIVYNWGPGIVYLSNDSSGNVQGSIQVAVNGNREIRSRGAVWAVPTLGSSPVVDVQDEWGILS